MTEARCFTDMEELGDIALDAALIASSPAAHFQTWRYFVARGVPVFMEKPFPLAQDLARVADLARTTPPMMINFNRRFWPPYQRLLNAVKAAADGVPRCVSLTLVIDRKRWNPLTDHRMGKSEGGVLQDLGGHVVDFAVMLFGALPSDVSATESSGPDGARLSLRLDWPGGRSASCVIGYGRSNESLLIEGTAGRLAMNNPHGWLWKAERAPTGWGVQLADLASIGTYAICPQRSLMRWTTRAALQAFFHGIKTGRPHPPGLDEALGVARVLAAAEQSLVTGSRIALGA